MQFTQPETKALSREFEFNEFEASVYRQTKKIVIGPFFSGARRWSLHYGYLDHEDLFCIVLLYILSAFS